GGGISTLANTRIIGSPLALALASDSGADARDSVTNNANINVQGIAAGGSWQYQVDGTAGSWLTGTGSSFTATSGMHSYFVRQMDAAGNAGVASQINSILDTSAPDSIHAVGSASIAANGVGAVSLAADAHDVSASSSVNWALGVGGDTALFELNNGVLSFKVAPNYEMPRGAALNADMNPNTYYVYVTATDLAGNVSAPTAIAITVMDVNQAPMQAALIADQTDDQALLVGEVVSFDISGAFSDPNVEANSQAAAIGQWGTLTYAATGLPTGLSLDARTGVIGGTATSTTDTAALVAVTATDGGGLSAITSFNLEVASSTVVEGVFLGGPVLKNVIGRPLTVQAVDLKGNPIKNSNGAVITAPVKNDGTYSLNLGNNVGTKVENMTGVLTIKVVDNNGPAADYHDETTGTKSAGSNFSATVVITKGLTQTANINAITTVASKVILRSVSSGIVSLNNADGIVNGGNDHMAIAAVSTPVNKTLVNQVNLQVGKSLLGQSVDVTKVTPTPTIKVTNANTVVANIPPDGTPTASVQAGKVLTLLSAAEQLPKGKALLTNLNIRLLQKTTQLGVAPQNLAAAESAVTDFLSAVAALIAPSINGTSVDSELESALQDLYIQAGARINAATAAGIITGMLNNDVDNVLQTITPASVLIVASQDVIPKNNGELGSATVRCKFAKPPVVGSFTLADLVATGGTLSNLVWDESGTLYTVTFTPTPGTTATTATITLAANASFVVEENGVSTTYSVGGVNPLTSNSSGFVFSLGIPAPSLELDQDSGVSASDNLTNDPQVHVFGLVGGSGNSWQYQVDGGTWGNDVTGNAFSLTAGVHTYNVRQINLGETATASVAVVYTLDTTAPLAPTLRLASDTGVSATDGITNNPTLNVSGVESGATWVYQLDGTTGVWISGTAASFTASSGAHRYFVQQTDMAGNVGAVGVFNYTLDTSMPTGIRSVGTTGNVAENGIGAIQLTADSSVTWTLGTGFDTALFEFNNGVLSFKMAPNYEQPRGSAFNANTNNNTYIVNVIATDTAGNASASTPLMVLVSDINEA
ncbi:MAG: Ig-like domain-containing protein, partial [Methylophilaceae bacterium]|nr:Ig-like domain-containing protein [Methylophilaceae bacterium]